MATSNLLPMKNFIGLGTAAIGRPQYINVRKADRQALSLKEFRRAGLHMIEYAYANGIRYFDTAPGYGMAEDILIEWLKDQKDPQITAATKWGYTYMADFDPNARIHEVKEHSLSKLDEQWQKSMNLLPFLKYYQIHSATLDTGVLENRDVLARLFEIKEKEGIAIGLTTTGHNQVEVLKRALDVHYGGSQLFGVFQCTYNVLDQSIYGLGQQILEGNKRLVIKEALANGRLFPNEHYPGYKSLYDTVLRLSNKYETGIDAILLHFCYAKLEGATVLSGADRTEHLAQNLKANEIELIEEDLEAIAHFKTPPKEYWEERKRLVWR